MRRAKLFVSVVLPSGWFLGYVLAKKAEAGASGSAALILVSLGAVVTPALMTLLLFTPSERRALWKQVRFSFGALPYLVAVGSPLLTHVAGSLPAILMVPEIVQLLPDLRTLILALQMLPMMVLWGAFEEIGWRGFLVPELARVMSGAKASLVVGFVWGLWHVPQVFFSSLPYEGAFRDTPFVGAALWIGATVAFGGVLGWLQLRTGSFVLPTLAHALINVVGSAFAEGRHDASSPVWAGPGGLAAILATTLLVWSLFALAPLRCRDRAQTRSAPSGQRT